jgi:hypothetical protein
VGPALPHNHVLLGTIVALLEKDEILTDQRRTVLEADQPNGPLSLETTHVAEVLGLVSEQFPLPVPEYHVSEELRESGGLKRDGPVRFDACPIGTFESGSHNSGHAHLIRLGRYNLARTLEVTGRLLPSCPRPRE